MVIRCGRPVFLLFADVRRLGALRVLSREREGGDCGQLRWPRSMHNGLGVVRLAGGLLRCVGARCWANLWVNALV